MKLITKENKSFTSDHFNLGDAVIIVRPHYRELMVGIVVGYTAKNVKILTNYGYMYRDPAVILHLSRKDVETTHELNLLIKTYNSVYKDSLTLNLY